MENQQMDSGQIKDLIDKSNEKLEELISTLSSANLILEGRVNNNKERFSEIKDELRDVRADIADLKDKTSRMDEKLTTVYNQLGTLFQNLSQLQDLKVSNAVQESRTQKFEKNWTVVGSVITAIIIGIIMLIIESLTRR